MATILKADGTTLVAQTPPSGKKKYSLQELQAVVGGLIERVRVGRRHMYVNEEGLIHGLPYNHEASKMAGMHIVGDVIIPDKGEA